jgi:hypothetical protein
VTDPNKYNPPPASFTIACPTCAGPAEFRFPFELVTAKRPSQLEPWPSAEDASWGGWRVIQHDPSLYRWKQPPQGYTQTNDGIRRCPRCVGRFKHVLDWPADAYYRFDLREALLWAWTRQQAVALADFIESKERRPEATGSYLFLHHVPKAFLAHGARERIVRKIRSRLAELG